MPSTVVEAKPIPKHRGRATKKTPILEDTSLLLEEPTFFIKTLLD
jgi:hypothetical protein